MGSVCHTLWPAVWVFSLSGFHCLFATKPVSSETSKAERRSSWRPWFYLGLVAHRFFRLSERALGSTVRLHDRGALRLANRLRLALEPECLENRRPPPERNPGMERTRSETLKLFVVSRIGRRSFLLSPTRSIQWWRSFLPRSDAPSLVSCPGPATQYRPLGMARLWSMH